MPPAWAQRRGAGVRERERGVKMGRSIGVATRGSIQIAKCAAGGEECEGLARLRGKG